MINISKQASSLNLDNNFLSKFSLGHKRLVSAVYWISTILESDIEHYKTRDLNSWMYLRFKTIAIIDPDFYQNYVFGGQYLSIIKDDLSGASEIYELGLKKFPNDFQLLKDSAFHYYFEARDREKAYPLLKQLEKHPKAPVALVSLLARIENENGDAYLALKILEDKIALMKDHENSLYKVLLNHIYSLHAEIDLNCLNENKGQCKQKDYFGEKYIYQNGKFQAQYKWEKFITKPLRKK